MKKILIVLSIIFIPAILFAHKLNIFAYYEDGKINIESFFSDGTPCKNCNVKILENNNIIFQGKLNAKGEITVNKKLDRDVKIKVVASMGHESVFNLKINKTEKEKAKKSTEKKVIIAKNSENLLPEIRKIVREELEKQLKPIILQLAKIEGNRTEKIVSGIGYILGIFGLLMLFKKKG